MKDKARMQKKEDNQLNIEELKSSPSGKVSILDFLSCFQPTWPRSHDGYCIHMSVGVVVIVVVNNCGIF